MGLSPTVTDNPALNPDRYASVITIMLPNKRLIQPPVGIHYEGYLLRYLHRQKDTTNETKRLPAILPLL